MESLVTQEHIRTVFPLADQTGSACRRHGRAATMKLMSPL